MMDKGIVAMVAFLILWALLALVWIGVLIWAVMNIVPAIVHFLTR